MDNQKWSLVICNWSLVLGRNGFTLIEVLISIGVLAILSSGVYFLGSGFLEKRVLDDNVSGIVATLRNAQTRATAGENDSNWGVHFNNNGASQQFYELYYGPAYASGTVFSTTYLSSRVQFVDPVAASSVDIMFLESTGLPALSESVTLSLISRLSLQTTISVNSAGLVSAVGFVFTSPMPTVTAASPASRGQGAFSQAITITGADFINGASASFSGSGISVNSTTFNSSTQVIANITISELAATGVRNVLVANPGSDQGICTGCFTVNAGPSVLSATPASLSPGSNNQDVIIQGAGFQIGASASFSGDGITVNSTILNSPTQITANITVAGGSTQTARDVLVTNATDGGTGTGIGIFTVTAGSNVGYETSGSGSNASGGGSCGAASAWTDVEICVKIPAGISVGSQPSKLRSNNLDSNTSAFTVQ